MFSSSQNQDQEVLMMFESTLERICNDHNERTGVLGTVLSETFPSIAYDPVFASRLTPSAGVYGTAPPGLPSNLFVKISQPSSVTSSVCSNCAVLLPSLVTLVQSSGHVLSRQLPRLIIGSIVNVIPGLHTPTALFFA
jgi:hypothetical protein